MLDKQQIELLATAWLESRLIKEGFEVARPIRDRGIDLVVYSDTVNKPFHAVPIQIKAASERSFSLDRKYAGRGIVMAYIWNVLSESPRLFLLPYETAVNILPAKTLQTESWQNKGLWHITNPGKAITEALEQYENNFSHLQCL